MKKGLWVLVCAVVLVLVWASWFFRYTPIDRGLLLDRWNGQVILQEVVFPESD